MKIGSLFSGIGGLELGLERAGLGRVVWQVEKDAFCRRVLAKHWPLSDRSVVNVSAANSTNLAPVDVLCGGFPCQDVSTAGRQAGLAGERSGLWREYLRLVGELRPAHVVVENVAGGARAWLPFVRRDLHVLGYDTLALAISAFDVGAPHQRERIFVFAADARGEQRGIQPGRRERPNRTGETLAPGPGREGAPADTIGEQLARGRGLKEHRQPLRAESGRASTYANGVREHEPEGSFGQFWRWSQDGGAWAIEPPFCGVDDGLSSRLDRGHRARRIKALGNAVVPQCAEAAARWWLDVRAA